MYAPSAPPTRIPARITHSHSFDPPEAASVWLEAAGEPDVAAPAAPATQAGVPHLVRLNRVTVVAMLASLASLGTACLVFDELLRSAEPPLFGPWGLFYLGTRLVVGLALPLLFAAMAASSLRFRNTRSATGILYASTVLVLIGTAVSVFLQDSYRVPL